jgi:hypothetical protein
MFNAQKPDPSELPSTGRLLKSTGIAAVIASALLVVVVLPAEYGVDPTGAGSLLGLTEMGRIKMQLAEEAAADASADDVLAAPEMSAPAQESLPPASKSFVPTPTPPATPTAPAVSTPAPAAPAEATAKDESVFTLAPDEGFEIKLVMEKDAKATFEWFTDGPGVNYDTHADGEGINYHGYGKGTNTPRQSGELVAAFKGQHGWFWRNRTEDDVTITLRTSGEYTDLKQYD